MEEGMSRRMPLLNRAMDPIKPLQHADFIDQRYVLKSLLLWLLIAAALRLWIRQAFIFLGGWYLPLIVLGLRVLSGVVITQLDYRSRYGKFPYRARVEIAPYLIFARTLVEVATVYVQDLEFNQVLLPGIPQRLAEIQTRLDETVHHLFKLWLHEPEAPAAQTAPG